MSKFNLIFEIISEKMEEAYASAYTICKTHFLSAFGSSPNAVETSFYLSISSIFFNTFRLEHELMVECYGVFGISSKGKPLPLTKLDEAADFNSKPNFNSDYAWHV